MKFINLPDALGLSMWGAADTVYQFVISRDEEGYRASYKDSSRVDKMRAIFIEDSDTVPFKSLQQAEAACRRQLKRLTN